MQYINGDYYRGEWENDMFNGYGTYCRKGIFGKTRTGYWTNDRFDISNSKFRTWLWKHYEKRYKDDDENE